MMKIHPVPKQQVIKDALDYDPDTGVFTWKKRADQSANWNSKWAGKTAGSKNKKGIKIYLNWVSYPAHRLAYVYAHGDILDTDKQIDHEDCNPHNNSIKNLRPATHGQNCTNSRGWGKKNLPKGVSVQNSGGYRARIGVDGRVVHIGTFTTAEEAHLAYMKEAKKFKGEYARAN